MHKDLTYALRQFCRARLLSAVVILLLGIGIGANVLIFSFINALLLKPLPVRDPQSLFLLEKMHEKQVRPDTSFSYRQFEALRKRTDLFSGIAAEQEWAETNAVPLGEAGGVRLVMTQLVSPNYFSELGVSAFFGRTLTEADATATSNTPVVLSYQFWQSQFGGNPNVLGRTIRLKKFPFLIVGVLPRDFHSLDIERAPDVRMPISAATVLLGHSIEQIDAERWGTGLQMLARLRPGITAARTAAAVTAQMQNIEEWEMRELFRSRPDLPQNNLEANLEYIREYHLAWQPVGLGISQLRNQFSNALELLMSGVALLLFIVCANITGLLLAKSEDRRKELAIRVSIGASRWRLMRQLITENLLLAVPGGLVGITFSYAFSPLLVELLPPARSLDQYASPRILNITPDARVLLFSLAATIFSVLIFSILPAWRGANVDLNSELKGTGRISSPFGSGLGPVALQIALSVLMISAGGLMLRTYWNLEHLNPGFDRAHIVSFTLDLKDAGYSDKQSGTFLDELDRRTASLHGVRSTAYTNRGLMRGAGLKMTVAPQGVILPRSTFLNTSGNSVSLKYFETLGTPLLAGRNLAPGDETTKPTRIVVNRAFADLLSPHQNPIGKFIVNGTDGTKPPTSLIVGLVGTAKYRSMREVDPPTLYWLLHNNDTGPFVLYIRTFGDPTAIINSVRQIIHKLDPAVPVMEVATLAQEVQNSLWQERLVALLSAFFSLIALVLADIGLYGALAYSVSRRTRELGIRMAVGAQILHILQTICGRLAWAVAIGIVLGILASFFLLGVTRHFLFGVSPLDPDSFAFAIAAVLVCATLAAALPSWRAINTDAAAALREE
jgi:predicted permease